MGEAREEVPPLAEHGRPAFYGRYAHWQWKPHIYLNPLYYIDYCMAGTVAFQVWTLSLQDRRAAWEKYLAFVDKAGTKTFADLCQSVGLRIPYEDGCIREVGSGIRDWLKAHARWRPECFCAVPLAVDDRKRDFRQVVSECAYLVNIS